MLRPALRSRCRWPALFAALCALLLAACQSNDNAMQAECPEITAYVELIMPARVELQRHWTRPVDYSGAGDADGLEVVLAAYDSFNDLTKMVGTLHLELYTRRLASSDHLGERIGFWPIELDSKDSLTRYWEPMARFYKFPVKLPSPPLPGGDFVLVARLSTPGRVRLSDEYEFAYESGTAPPAATFGP